MEADALQAALGAGRGVTVLQAGGALDGAISAVARQKDLREFGVQLAGSSGALANLPT